jgi:hypothetical protein
MVQRCCSLASKKLRQRIPGLIFKARICNLFGSPSLHGSTHKVEKCERGAPLAAVKVARMMLMRMAIC